MDVFDIEDHKNKKQEHFEMVFEFLDKTPSFAYGFECGALWSRMKAFFETKSNYELRDVAFNAANFAMVCRMCNALDVTPDVVKEENWYVGSIKRRVKT